MLKWFGSSLTGPGRSSPFYGRGAFVPDGSRSDIKDQINERRTSVLAGRPLFAVVRHLSPDIDVNATATNRIMLSGLVRFVPVNKRERERTTSDREAAGREN